MDLQNFISLFEWMKNMYINQSTKWEDDEVPGSNDGPVAGHALPLLEAAADGNAKGEQDDSTEDS